MSYSIWLKVEPDGEDYPESDPVEAWWSLSTHTTRAQAITQAELYAEQLEYAFDVPAERLED